MTHTPDSGGCRCTVCLVVAGNWRIPTRGEKVPYVVSKGLPYVDAQGAEVHFRTIVRSSDGLRVLVMSPAAEAELLAMRAKASGPS